ncbi:MAG: apolipoprotein N-acyltransferase [Thermodesulfobacteriota bacterium]
MRPAVLVTMSALIYAVAFPPLALRALAWIALVPLLVAIRMSSRSGALGLGALWAFVMTFVTSDSLPRAVVNYYQQSAAVGWLLLFGATVVTMVPYYAAFALCYWSLARRFHAALPLLTAAAWVGAELARVKILGGNPWSVSGYSQVGFLPLMQIADVAGVHGMSFVLVAVNASLAEAWLRRAALPPLARRTRRAHVATATLVLGVLGYGAVRLAGIGESDFGMPTRIAVVQGNLDLGHQWRRDMYGRNLEEYLRLTWEAVRAASPALVFWPESAMTFFVADEPRFQSAIAGVLRPGGVELIAGGPRIEEHDRTAPLYFNSTFLLSPEGRILGWQDKTKLLPFAEYFPLGGSTLVLRDFGRARQFSAGQRSAPLASLAGQAGIVVCNEAMFPEPSRERVAAGAEYLVSPANDSWFADLEYSLQAFDNVRLRSVEQRRFLVRTSTAGPSAIVDPLGRVIAVSRPFAAQWIAGSIRPGRGRTVYHRVGDLFAAACAAAAMAAAIVASCNRVSSGRGSE